MRGFTLAIAALLISACRVQRIDPDADAAATTDAATDATQDAAAQAPSEPAVDPRLVPWLTLPAAGELVFALSGTPDVSASDAAAEALQEASVSLRAPGISPLRKAVEGLCALERADVGRLLSGAPPREDGLRSFDAAASDGATRWAAIGAAPELRHASHAVDDALARGLGLRVGPAATRWATSPSLEPPPALDAHTASLSMWRAWGVTTPLALPAPLPLAPAPQPSAEAASEASAVEEAMAQESLLQSVAERPAPDPARPAPTRPTWVLVRDAQGRFAAVASFAGAPGAATGEVSPLVYPGAALWVGERGVVAVSSPAGSDRGVRAREVHAQLAKSRSAEDAAQWGAARVAAGTTVIVLSGRTLAAAGAPGGWAAWTHEGVRSGEPPAP